MESPNNRNKSEAILKICVVLSFLSAFVVLALSVSLHRIEHENKNLDIFVSSASELSSDFEQSLLMYTENTQDAMQFVDTIRPNSDSEYIDFISTVEGLGQSLGLEVNLESLDTVESDALAFSVDFYGTKSKLIEFLDGLEVLDHYVRIESLSYKDLALVAASEEGELMPNIELTFLLYVK